MGHPIHTHNTMVKAIDVARIQNTQQQREETQRRQFALTLQEEAAHKEHQVQDSHKTESLEIHEKNREKGKKRGRKKRSRGESPNDQNSSGNEEQHIDLKID